MTEEDGGIREDGINLIEKVKTNSKLITHKDELEDIASYKSKQVFGLFADKPLEIKYVPQITNIGIKDYIALVKWAGYTNDKHITIPKDKIMTITNASKEMIKSYRAVIVDYNTYDKLIRREENERTKKLMDREMMSPSEREEFEDIFDNFEQFKKKTKDTLH